MTAVLLNKMDASVLISPTLHVGNVVGSKSKNIFNNLHFVDNTQRLLTNNVIKEKRSMLLNKQGSLFLGMPKMAMPMKPGYIRSLADERRGIDNSVKYRGGSVYNPLNKHGNAFQGIPKPQSDNIRSLANERRSIDNSVKYRGGPVYNPLNKHGNVFQGIPKLQSDNIRGLAGQQREINSTVKWRTGSVYNPLNKHGNTFQGFPANIKKECMEKKEFCQENVVDMDLDDHVFEHYTLFPVSNETKTNVESLTDKESKESLTFKDNRPYYQIAFFDMD